MILPGVPGDLECGRCKASRPTSWAFAIGMSFTISLPNPGSAQSVAQNFVVEEWSRFLQECGPYFALTRVEYKKLFDTISQTYQTTDDGSLLHWVYEDPALSLWKAVQITYGPSGYQIDCEMNQFRSPPATPGEIGAALKAMVEQTPELNMVGGKQLEQSGGNTLSENGVHYSVFGAIPGLPYPIDINVTDEVFNFYAAAFIPEAG